MQGSRVGKIGMENRHKCWILQSPCCFQNRVLLSLLAVVRVQSSPEEQCTLSAMRIVTQLWLRMSADQVRPKYTHIPTHTEVWIKCMAVIPITCHPPGADPPCAPVYPAAALVNISHFSEKHRASSHLSGKLSVHTKHLFNGENFC